MFMLPNSVDIEKLNELIEINSEFNSNYEDIDNLLVSILKSVMRLVPCEFSSILLVNKNDTLMFQVVLGPKGVEVITTPVKMNESIAGVVVRQNSSIIVDDVKNHPLFFSQIEEKINYEFLTMIAVPLRVDNVCVGVIQVLNKIDNEKFNKRDQEILELIGVQAGIAYKNATAYHKINNEIVKRKSSDLYNGEYQEFIGNSQSVLDMLRVVEKIAVSNSSVLILGESGVGKEIIAKRIHCLSDRCDNNFVCVNYSNLEGSFEAADGGTIFLDEISEMPLRLQAKLVRVMQFREFEKIGSNETKSVDIRIIAATNRNLEEMVNVGTFRSDLYFRLNVLPVSILPLRKRVEDIELLIHYFVKKFSIETKKRFTHLSDSALKVCKMYYWPGNVRELKNSIERACILGTPPIIHEKDLCLNVGNNCENDFDYSAPAQSLAEAIYNYKKYYVHHILEECGWNNTKAAKVLDVQRTYISRLMTELDIKKVT